MIQVGISALGLHTSDITCTYPRYVFYPGLSDLFILVYQLLRHQGHHKTYTSLLLTMLQSGSKDFESGSFPVKTKLLLLQPSPVYANINYNITVKMGLPKEFCTLRLNCMHLTYICGTLMLKAGCFSHEFICSRYPSQCSVIHSASVSLYKGK